MNRNIEPHKSITFDKEAQDNLPQYVKDKMKYNQDKAKCKYCKGLGYDPYNNNLGVHDLCPECKIKDNE